MGIGSFPGVEAAGSWGRPPRHLECRGPRKINAIPLLALRAFAAYKKGVKAYIYIYIYSTNVVTVTRLWRVGGSENVAVNGEVRDAYRIFRRST